VSTLLTEARPAVEAAPDSTGRIEVTLITPGWGSSGYYSADILEQAATDGVFGAGLQCFVDHPSQRELNDRPERSVRDLAAVLTEAARWDGGRLVATAQLLPPHAETFRQPGVAEAVGMSIRASADVTMGEAEGRRGRIVGRLVEAQSVDFVTRAGRGGRYQVIESALPSRVVRDAVDHGVSEATANQLRDGLQQALRDAYGAEQSWVWIRDFDEATVWYEHETPDTTGLFQHSYAETDGAVTLTGDPLEVRVETRYVPVNPAGGSDTPTPTEESLMPQIEEARLGQLEEAAGRVPTLESERDQARQQLAESNARVALFEAQTTARPVIATKVAESKTLGARTQARIVESLLGALPMTDGKVDEPKLTAAIESAVKAAEAEIADYQPAVATTSLFGSFGSAQESASTGAEGEQLTESTVDANIGRAFGRAVKGN
jgi:hypothetical protein